MSVSVDKLRIRCWSCICYLPVDVLIKRLKLLYYKQSLVHFAFIVHDKDLDESGALKPYHVHLVLVFKNAWRYRNLLTHFTCVSLNAGNLFAERLTDFDSMVNYYFLHKMPNNDGKFQYPMSAIVTDDISYWQSLPIVHKNKGDECLDIIDALNDKVPVRDLVLRYGRDFVYHYSDYKFMADLCRVSLPKNLDFDSSAKFFLENFLKTVDN